MNSYEYQVGGSLATDAPSYVMRTADGELKHFFANASQKIGSPEEGGIGWKGDLFSRLARSNASWC